MFKRIVYLLAFLSLVSAGPSFGGTTWRDRRAMRVSVYNWQTPDEDVERVVKAVASVLTSNR